MKDMSIPAYAKWLFAQNCTFVAGVQHRSAMIPATLPEIAFVGRSNVGKSSLINALTNRKALARVSHTPGRTQQLNFFNLGGQLMLVDLPGYGYAQVSKRLVQNWNALMFDYLKGRQNLARVYLLIDSRHGLKDSDKEVMTMLDKTAVSYHIVGTKADELSLSDRTARYDDLVQGIKTHVAAYPDVILTSTRNSWGIHDVQQAIVSAAFPDMIKKDNPDRGLA